MNDVKYTPGPWTWFPGVTVRHRGPEQMKFLKGSDGQGFAHTVGLDEPRDTANANLIAAAPELLEACENAFNAWVAKDFHHRCQSGIMDEMVAMESAIEKAKGASE